MVKKIYGVKAPEKKIFDDWEECQKYTKGLKGAIFKSFISLEECMAFVYDDRAELNPQKAFVRERFNVSSKDVLNTPSFDLTKPLEAHVDGSFNKERKMFGAGIVFVQDGLRVFEYCFSGPDKFGEWQVCGEVYATLKAIEIAIRYGFDFIEIWHDMIHLSAWPLGYYKVNKGSIAEKYTETYQSYAEEIKIKFIKESAHDGELFNERADRLAKLACGKL